MRSRGSVKPVRAELMAITVRRADRADRMMAALGACDATVGAYRAVSQAFTTLGDHASAREYALRAARCADLATDGPLEFRNPRWRRPTVPVCTDDIPRCPDRSGCPVALRPGVVLANR